MWCCLDGLQGAYFVKGPQQNGNPITRSQVYLERNVQQEMRDTK
jgi:hypothetical protein